MKKAKFLSSSLEGVKVSLEREKVLLDELNDRHAIEACIFRILSCEKRLYMMNLKEEDEPSHNFKERER
jgi:hypothetical protein